MTTTAAAAAAATSTAQINPHEPDEILHRVLRPIDRLAEVKLASIGRDRRIPLANQGNFSRKVAVDRHRVAILVLPSENPAHSANPPCVPRRSSGSLDHCECHVGTDAYLICCFFYFFPPSPSCSTSRFSSNSSNRRTSGFSNSRCCWCCFHWCACCSSCCCCFRP